MKKNLLFVTIVCFYAAQLCAQDNPYSPYLQVKIDTLETKKAYNAQGELVGVEGEYRAGVQECNLTYSVDKALMPSPWQLPDTNQYRIIRELHIYDKQATPVTEYRKWEDITKATVHNIMSARMSKEKIYGDNSYGFYLERGGEYYVNMQFSAGGSNQTKEITFPDYPSIRNFDNREKTEVGHPINYQVRYNTGYPYEPSSYIDGLYSKVTLTDTAFNVLGSKQISLTFKTNPLYKKAVIDTLQFNHEPLPAGKYHLIHETNWEFRPGASLIDTMLLMVNDTLRASSAINKAEFTKAETADLTFSINYGFPYITVNDSITKKPYVNVAVNIVDSIKWPEGDLKALVVLKTDTIRIMDDSLAFKTLDYQDAFHFAMADMPDSVLNKTLYANIEVYYNKYPYYKKAHSLKVTGQATALPQVAEEQDAMYYDLLGRPVGTKPTTPGIYVTKGKKIIVR